MSVAGVAVVVVVVLLLELELPPPAGGGLMIVGLFPAGDAAGELPGATTFSVRCSHDAKSAALAMMQIYLVISLIGLDVDRSNLNRTNKRVRSCPGEYSLGATGSHNAVAASPRRGGRAIHVEGGEAAPRLQREPCLERGLVLQAVRFTHGCERETAVPRVDAAGERRLLLACTLEPEVSEQLDVARCGIAQCLR